MSNSKEKLIHAMRMFALRKGVRLNRFELERMYNEVLKKYRQQTGIAGGVLT